MLAQTLDAIPVPALIIGADDALMAANPAFRAVFPRVELGRSYLSVLRQPGLDRLISDTRAGVANAQADIHLHSGVERVFHASAAPLPDGALLVCLQDTSETAAAVQSRRDFIADLSHELRTPLTSIRGILDATQGDAQGLAQFVPVLGQEVDRMTRLVTDLIALNRVQANARRRPDAPTCLQDVVAAATRPLMALAGQLGANIAIEQPDTPIIVPADADELIQALTNLLENALRYGAAADGKDSIVTCGLTHEPGHATLSVRDNGPGVAPHHLPRLTERFYRIDDHRSRAAGGSGLGLAIVKHVANRHRANLSFANAPSGGLIAQLTLPAPTKTTDQPAPD